MKRLIVLAAAATLLASLSGCSILGNKGAQSCDTCDTTSPLRSKLSRLRPNITLPWNREVAASTPQCNSCQQGFTTTGYASTGIVESGVPTSTQYSNLYHPEIVGGVIEGPVLQGAPVSAPVAGPSVGTIPSTDLGDFD